MNNPVFRLSVGDNANEYDIINRIQISVEADQAYQNWAKYVALTLDLTQWRLHHGSWPETDGLVPGNEVVVMMNDGNIQIVYPLHEAKTIPLAGNEPIRGHLFGFIIPKHHWRWAELN